jgi:hypothetical protein
VSSIPVFTPPATQVSCLSIVCVCPYIDLTICLCLVHPFLHASFSPAYRLCMSLRSPHSFYITATQVSRLPIVCVCPYIDLTIPVCVKCIRFYTTSDASFLLVYRLCVCPYADHICVCLIYPFYTTATQVSCLPIVCVCPYVCRTIRVCPYVDHYLCVCLVYQFLHH